MSLEIITDGVPLNEAKKDHTHLIAVQERRLEAKHLNVKILHWLHPRQKTELCIRIRFSLIAQNEPSFPSKIIRCSSHQDYCSYSAKWY